MRRSLSLFLLAGWCTIQVAAQSDTLPSRLLPEAVVLSRQFSDNGYGVLPADSLPVNTVISLTDRLLWENLLSVRANAPGTLATVSMRGAGPSRTPVFWNGLNLQSPMNGVVDASLLPLWPADQVSIQYGGQSALQSSGAMGGSVHIATPAADHMGWSGTIGASAGSFDRYEGQASIGYGQEKISSQARISWQQAENNFPFKNTTLLGQPRVRQVNNYGEKLNIQQFNRLIINPVNAIRTAVWYQRAFREIPPAMTEAPLQTWQRDRATRATAIWEHTPNARIHWETQAAFLQEAIYFYREGVTDSSAARTVLLRTVCNRTLDTKTTAQFGASALRQWARADGYTDSTRWEQQARMAVFASLGRRVKGGQLTLLLRQEWAENQAAPFTGSLGGQFGLGRAGALRFHISRNFNLPTFNDRFWRNLGSPDLLPEKGYSADAGWQYKKRSFSTEVTVFQLILDNWILWQPGSDGQFRPGNLRKVWSRGVEWNGGWQHGFGLWQLRLNGRYQFSTTTNVAVYAGQPDVLRKQLTYTPRHAAGLTLQLKRGPFSGAYLHQLTGSRFTTSDNRTQLPAFQTGQLLVQYVCKIWRLQCTVDLRMENVWNTPYQIIAFRPQTGRAWQGGITFAW